MFARGRWRTGKSFGKKASGADASVGTVRHGGLSGTSVAYRGHTYSANPTAPLQKVAWRWSELWPPPRIESQHKTSSDCSDNFYFCGTLIYVIGQIIMVSQVRRVPLALFHVDDSVPSSRGKQTSITSSCEFASAAMYVTDVTSRTTLPKLPGL